MDATKLSSAFTKWKDVLSLIRTRRYRAVEMEVLRHKLKSWGQ